MDHIKLLCDISEINHLFRDSVSVESFMQQTVEMVAKHMSAQVCSIYVYDEDEETLYLKATKGLSSASVDNVTMKFGEGLTGLALKELRPVCVTNASKQPNYKHFDSINEEPFENFLAVPIRRGITRIGVLVLQRDVKHAFVEDEISACKVISSQLANIIENAKFLISLHQPQEEKTKPISPVEFKFIRGKAASEGFALCQAKIMDRERTFDFLFQKTFTKRYSLEDFDRAVGATIDQLQQLQSRVEERLSDAASLICASHLLILKDHEFIGAMRKLIEEGANPPTAVIKIAKEYIDIFSSRVNHYVREKVQDIEDIVVRLIGNIASEMEELGDFSGRIVIAKELFPSDLLMLSSEDVKGIVLISGGVTSHLSILARSLQIPMIIAGDPDLLRVIDNTQILLDADAGNCYLNPTEEVISSFEERNEARKKIVAQKVKVAPQTLTSDGTRIKLLANINLISDLKHAQELNCEGVGLYRTEFPFIIRSDFPSEEEQFITYRKLATGISGKPVIFRTLDIGGDKIMSYYHDAKELNPSMGMRSIRFSLQNPDVFTRQIRAILRAGLGENLGIMFPMISSIDEFRQAKHIVLDCSSKLSKQGIEHNNDPQIGIMVELPSVIHLMDAFAEECDFFSIGTNDLVQFMLGVDRTNENVAAFYQPFHPSVLRAISQVVSCANGHQRQVSVCGDIPINEKYIAFLLGIGLRTLSIEPAYLPRIQQLINKIDVNSAQELAKELLAQNSAEQIAKMMEIDQA
jgi:phosphotransferase system, enzyme I, PtsP